MVMLARARINRMIDGLDGGVIRVARAQANRYLQRWFLPLAGARKARHPACPAGSFEPSAA